MYDSTEDTQNHIKQVQDYLFKVIENLGGRLNRHDKSKLNPPEKEVFDIYTPLLRELTYGSIEYKSALDSMQGALLHHYKVNSHHPEHYHNGINGMSLFDLIEMLVDWKAATLRHADGDIVQSLRINKGRFDISDQLAEILQNTVIEMGWLDVS